MITYFVTAAHRYTIDLYLESWGFDLRQMIQVRVYSDLAGVQSLPGGTYIFSDLERLTPAMTVLVADLWRQLEAAGPNVKLVNHPERALRREGLLKALHAAGKNDFRIYRVTDDLTNIRFPVFIRCANDHDGARTGLLNTHEAVEANLRAALCYGQDPRELLIVEYLNAADAEGIHHKYSAFRVGDRIVPRHLLFSRKWMLKYPDLHDGDKIPREMKYLETNPHQQALLEIYETAGIEYGRCDYSVIDGRIQVWEINTNPILLRPHAEYEPDQMPKQDYFAKQIRPAFETINLKADPQLKIPIRFDRALLDRMIKV